MLVEKKDVTAGNYYLSNYSIQMNNNAAYIYQYLTKAGWTLSAISALLGNMFQESRINPGLWEGRNSSNVKGGFGLVQWTPSTNFTNWTGRKNKKDITDIDDQLNKILDELNNGGQWYSTSQYNISFKQFSKDTTHSIDWLTTAFVRNYERPNPLYESLGIRKDAANHYYKWLLENCTFKPRTTEPTPGDANWKYYKSNWSNYWYPAVGTKYEGCVLANCTGYAFGRFSEILGKYPSGLGTGHAKQWITETKKIKNHYTIGNKPQLGAIICWQGGSYGHVAIVEKIENNGDIWISESGYNSNPAYFQYIKLTKKEYENRWDSYTLEGFIYNPGVLNDIVFNSNDLIDPPIITAITQKSKNYIILNLKDELTINGDAKGNDKITTKLECYLKWNSDNVFSNNYDEKYTLNNLTNKTNRTFTWTVNKPLKATKVCILLKQINSKGTSSVEFKQTYDLIGYQSIIHLGKNKKAQPYVYHNGKWEETILQLYTNHKWIGILEKIEK